MYDKFLYLDRIISQTIFIAQTFSVGQECTHAFTTSLANAIIAFLSIGWICAIRRLKNQNMLILSDKFALNNCEYFVCWKTYDFPNAIMSIHCFKFLKPLRNLLLCLFLLCLKNRITLNELIPSTKKKKSENSKKEWIKNEEVSGKYS